MIQLLVALYPASWRRRYGDEFRAVLESRPLGPFDVADVLLGAFDARLRSVSLAGHPSQSGGQAMMLRIGGVGAISGASLWVIGFIGASLAGASSGPWMGLLILGTLGLLLALVGLSAFQARRNPRLAWAAFLIPGIGSVMSIVGLYGMVTMPDTDVPLVAGLGSWAIWALGSLATLVGSVLFAIATYRAAVLSRPAALGLAGSSVLVLLLMLGASGSGTPGIEFPATLVAFAASWAWLGLTALRRGPIRAVAVPAQ